MIWRELDGELVVRNERSGSTHLLDPLASGLLRTLAAADAGVSVADLVARLGGGVGDQGPAASAAAIEAILDEFQRLGLAEPSAC